MPFGRLPGFWHIQQGSLDFRIIAALQWLASIGLHCPAQLAVCCYGKKRFLFCDLQICPRVRSYQTESKIISASLVDDYLCEVCVVPSTPNFLDTIIQCPHPR